MKSYGATPEIAALKAAEQVYSITEAKAVVAEQTRTKK
jgi:hypothetical protein